MVPLSPSVKLQRPRHTIDCHALRRRTHGRLIIFPGLFFHALFQFLLSWEIKYYMRCKDIYEMHRKAPYFYNTRLHNITFHMPNYLCLDHVLRHKQDDQMKLRLDIPFLIPYSFYKIRFHHYLRLRLKCRYLNL